MTEPRGPFWSALVWSLNGALCLTWLFGTVLAFQARGWQEAALAFLVPPYGMYVAWTGYAPDEASDNLNQWLDPSRSETVERLVARCETERSQPRLARLSPRQFEEYCLCLARSAVDLRSRMEVEVLARTGAVPPAFAQALDLARDSCYSTAVFISPGASPARPPAGAD